uniref:NadR/Ttd14 AAA domain-containing protein n=1 Tax=Romanomermis culicivorax TaxID=13658 RepID=A0A915IP36_ROMCU
MTSECDISFSFDLTLAPEMIENDNLKSNMDGSHSPACKTIYKIVLTGGPCGGKTTAQERLANFFECLGWKVFRPPETATLLFRGGILFSELSDEQVETFQNDLLLTVMQIEKVYINLSEGYANQNVLLVFDRGTMDGSAYLPSEMWTRILKRNDFNAVDLRDNRYDQIIHMVTAADGAPDHYTVANNVTRYEGIAQAIATDVRTRQAWVGHPYVDIIDNFSCKSFEDKILKLIQVVCDRIGIDYGDRLAPNSRKRKFLVTSFDEANFSKYEEFHVIHRYLRSDEKDVQVRLRKRGQNGFWSYTHTTRRGLTKGQKVETRMQISAREYAALCEYADPKRCRTFKRRRCFLYEQQYYQLDIYCKPLPEGFDKLIILETYTTNTSPDMKLPPFLNIAREITGDVVYSLYTLSLKTRASVDFSSKTESDDENFNN